MVEKHLYYIYVNGKQLGPCKYDELKILLNEKKIRKDTYVFREGMERWEYITELPEFDQRKPVERPAAPVNEPASLEIERAEKGEKGDIYKRVWLVFDKGRRLGPYSDSEVMHHVKAKDIRRSSLVWKKGMKDWSRIMDLKEFESVCYPKKPKALNKTNVGDFQRFKQTSLGMGPPAITGTHTVKNPVKLQKVAGRQKKKSRWLFWIIIMAVIIWALFESETLDKKMIIQLKDKIISLIKK